VDRFLTKLEKKIGRFAVPRLAWIITGGLLAVFVMMLVKKELWFNLRLDVEAVKDGEAWRLVTYAFIPFGGNPIFVLMNVAFVFWIANGLESEWGSFKLNVYYLFGLVVTTTAAVLVDQFYLAGSALMLNAQFLNLSLMFGFATLNPNLQVSYFFIPMKLKWLAFLDIAYMAYLCSRIGPAAWIVAGAACVNYLVFFAGHLNAFARGEALVARQAVRRASTRPEPIVSTLGARACAICGAKEADGADIRVCSCEKCGGTPRNLCLQHARNH
jgi:hypothetical protein